MDDMKWSSSVISFCLWNLSKQHQFALKLMQQKSAEFFANSSPKSGVD
jgi:hypothetical protein